MIHIYMSGSSGMVGLTLIANSPQLVLTFAYFTFNGIFTCMLLGREWSGYARSRKTLRVSSPKDMQRGTYRLQLPYHYGAPLLVLSGALHWLVSQSIFLARVTSFDATGKENYGNAISSCGYSPIAIITTIILGALVILFGIATGFRKYESSMPLAGSCSAAISAACHPPETDVHASLKPVMYGVVTGDKSNRTKRGIGHCSFTSFEVTAPVKGQLYVGLESREGDALASSIRKRL